MQANTQTNIHEDWRGGYESLLQEYDYWIDEIEGEVPRELHGTLFRNGPGLFEINGQPIHHPFDGDGMVCAITFDNGRVHFRNRFVRTEGFLAEQQAGRILYRGVFGTQRSGGWLNNMLDLSLKNIANTNVVYWGEKLLALWEAGKPHRLDPATLETLGADDMGGILSPGPEFAAHPHVDPDVNGSPHLVSFGVHPGLSTVITLYEFDQSGDLLKRHAYRIPGFAFVHDYALTPEHCIFFQNPVDYNPLPYLAGWCAAGQCLKLRRNAPTNILLLPRDPDGPVETVSFQMASIFIFHHANAFVQGEEEIVVDSVCYDDFPVIEPDQDFREIEFSSYPPGRLWRFTINRRTKQVDAQIIESRSCEFPAIHPSHEGRPYRYVFLIGAEQTEGNAPHQAIIKRDLAEGTSHLWSAAPRGFVGEPIFVPRSEQEDDGWVLTLVYDAEHHRSDVVILDGRDLTKGPLARLHLKHHVPYGLHGSFVPQVFGERKA